MSRGGTVSIGAFDPHERQPHTLNKYLFLSAVFLRVVCRPATLARRREVPESWLKERVALLEQEGRERAGALGLEKQATLQEAADARDLATRGRPGGALRPEELQGRASGSLAWRQARAEV